MTVTQSIPIDLLRKLIRLDAETGKLYWLERPGARVQWNACWTRRAHTMPLLGFTMGHSPEQTSDKRASNVWYS